MWEFTLGNGKEITALEASTPTEETPTGGLWFTFNDDASKYKHWVSWGQIETFGKDEDTYWTW